MARTKRYAERVNVLKKVRVNGSSYVSTAAAMRRDLWSKKTSIDETALKVVGEDLRLEKHNREAYR